MIIDPGVLLLPLPLRKPALVGTGGFCTVLGEKIYRLETRTEQTPSVTSHRTIHLLIFGY